MEALQSGHHKPARVSTLAVFSQGVFKNLKQRVGDGKWWQCHGVSGHWCYLALCSDLFEAEVQIHAYLKDPYWYDLIEKSFLLMLSYVLTIWHN